ncbi:MAG: hypothetical protein JXR83_01440 [Deltaproteobacteria bacterium]|nr:hypothetical protein [Deltaproteobacteria bacterium]
MSAHLPDAGGRHPAPGDLFSIDVDAELGKICGRSFRSPHHYPVELVRSALARGAARVALRLGRGRLEIEDDGAPLAAAQVTGLARLLDRDAPAEQRQQALYEMEQGAAGNLLALLAPAPSAVELRTGGGGGQGQRLLLRRGRVTLDDRAPARRGTAIAIARRGDPARERAVLRDGCRFARAEVRVDGALIGGAGQARAVLAAAAVPGWGAVRRCEIELPVDGDLCLFVRLAHDVVERRWAVESPSRLVYQVVFECDRELPADFADRALATARALYAEIVDRYPRLSAAERDRVDELLFRHYRADPGSALVGRLQAFRLLGGGQRLTLEQVRQRAGSGLCAVVEGEDIGRYDLVAAEVVELTPRQKHFLSHDAGLALPAPLLRPSPPGRWRSALAAIRGRARRSWRALASRIGRAQASAPDAAAADLVAAIRGAIESGRFAPPQVPAPGRLEVVWSARRSRVPCLVRSSGGRLTLVLCGRHRALRQAVTAFARDADNLVFILPALLDGHDGWRA